MGGGSGLRGPLLLRAPLLKIFPPKTHLDKRANLSDEKGDLLPEHPFLVTDMACDWRGCFYGMSESITDLMQSSREKLPMGFMAAHWVAVV